jgi:hypothetical protein
MLPEASKFSVEFQFSGQPRRADSFHEFPFRLTLKFS